MAGIDLIVILGPTAGGKSELALALAERIGADILSVDSMQVYRGMDIGTAKPTEHERQRIRHHLIDVVEPDEEFTAARFVEMADPILADARRRGKPIVATGGTPLYYKALFEGLFEGPPAEPELRERLKKLSGEQLHGRLQQVDPDAAGRIHSNDLKRLVRALEVFELTGKPISDQQRQWSTGTMRHPAKWVGLRWDKEKLNQRINQRVRQMVEAGWVQEVKELLSRFGNLSRTASEATGYRQMIQHVRGERLLDDAAEEIKIATRQLGRRQMKWFRRFQEVYWIDGELRLDQKLQQVLEWCST